MEQPPAPSQPPAAEAPAASAPAASRGPPPVLIHSRKSWRGAVQRAPSVADHLGERAPNMLHQEQRSTMHTSEEEQIQLNFRHIDALSEQKAELVRVLASHDKRAAVAARESGHTLESSDAQKHGAHLMRVELDRLETLAGAKRRRIHVLEEALSEQTTLETPTRSELASQSAAQQRLQVAAARCAEVDAAVHDAEAGAAQHEHVLRRLRSQAATRDGTMARQRLVRSRSPRSPRCTTTAVCSHSPHLSAPLSSLRMRLSPCAQVLSALEEKSDALSATLSTAAQRRRGAEKLVTQVIYTSPHPHSPAPLTFYLPSHRAPSWPALRAHGN